MVKHSSSVDIYQMLGSRESFITFPEGKTIPYDDRLEMDQLSRETAKLVRQQLPQLAGSAVLYKEHPQQQQYSYALEVKSTVNPRFAAALIVYEEDEEVQVAALWHHVHVDAPDGCRILADLLAEKLVVVGEHGSRGMYCSYYQPAAQLAELRHWSSGLLKLLCWVPWLKPRIRWLAIRSFKGTHDADLACWRGA